MLSWGDASGSWGPETFFDGSCLFSSIPEVARAGWAAVQLHPALFIPVRAIYGALPSRSQTIGKAERWAVFVGLARAPSTRVAVSDLQAVVRDGKSSDLELALGMIQLASCHMQQDSARDQRARTVGR